MKKIGDDTAKDHLTVSLKNSMTPVVRCSKSWGKQP